MLIVPYPPKVWLVKMLERRGRFLDPLAHAQLSELSACVVQGAMQDLLDCTHALGVQALFSLHRTKMHERITDKLLLIRRHQGSIQYWPARACGRRGSYGDLVRVLVPCRTRQGCRGPRIERARSGGQGTRTLMCESPLSTSKLTCA